MISALGVCGESRPAGRRVELFLGPVERPAIEIILVDRHVIVDASYGVVGIVPGDLLGVLKHLYAEIIREIDMSRFGNGPARC